MKAGVSLYSFHKYSANDSLGMKGCIEKAKEFGFTGLDFVEFGDPSSRNEYLKYAAEIGSFCKEVGMDPVCFCVGSDFVNKAADSEIDRVKFLAEVAATLGCPLMRHDATRGLPPTVKTKRGFSDLLPILAESYRNVTEYASTLGVKTCVENHGFFVQQSSRVEALINAVGHENFGALIDIGNFMCADEESAKAVGILAPYAFHAHAKDFHFRDGSLDAPGEGWFKTLSGDYIRGAILGHGVVRVRQCIETLARNGYDGYLALEFEGMEDPLRAIAISASNLKRLAGI
jgi:sugar phosphate isomerase/epimerase